MNAPLMVNVVSFILGAVVGVFSARMLIGQITDQATRSSRSVTLYPFIRLTSIALIGWYLLHWGPLAFILFGGSMVIAMWIVILTFTY